MNQFNKKIVIYYYNHSNLSDQKLVSVNTKGAQDSLKSSDPKKKVKKVRLWEFVYESFMKTYLHKGLKTMK